MASLETVLTTRLSEDAASWFREAIKKVRSKGEATDAFLILWSGAGRRLGQVRIEAPTASEQDKKKVPFFPRDWGADEFGRVLLLQAALGARLPEAHAALVTELFETGDLRERQAVLRALPHLPAPERFLSVGIEAVRNNAVSVIEAIACENPFPARHFPAEAFNQMILKCLFCEVSLRRVVDLGKRVTPELRRMVDGYAKERRAAGRSVPEDTALVLGP
jgi:hypothetical protein